MANSMTIRNLNDLFVILFRRKWLIIIPMFISILTAMMISLSLPKKYLSSATILIEEKRVSNPLIKGVAVATSVQSRMATLNTKILSHNWLEKLIHRVGLDRGIEDPIERGKIISELRRSIKVRGKRSVITVSYEGKEPTVTQSIVKNIVDMLIKANIKLQKEEVDSAMDFITAQLKIYQKKLEESESELRNFQEIHMLELAGTPSKNLEELLGISYSLNADMARLIQLQTSLKDIDIDLVEAKKKYSIINRQLLGQDRTIISQTTLELNPKVRELNVKLIKLEMRLADLLIDSTESHPMVKDLRKAISSTKDLIKEESEKTLSSETTTINQVHQELEIKKKDLERTIIALKARQSEIKSAVDELLKRVKDIPEKELEKSRLVREKRVNESIYTMLLNKLETAKITKNLEVKSEGTRFEILDSPGVPTKPIKPKKNKLMFLGLVFGILFSSGLVFAVEYADHSFRGIEDAKEFSKIPLLGAISEIVTTDEMRKKKHRRLLTIFFLIIILIASLVFGILWRLEVINFEFLRSLSVL